MKSPAAESSQLNSYSRFFFLNPDHYIFVKGLRLG